MDSVLTFVWTIWENVILIISKILHFFSPLGNWIVDFFSLVTGFSLEHSKTVLIATFFLFLLLVVFSMFRKWSYRSMLKSTQQLVKVYDKIFYFVAKKQYSRQQR